MRRIKLAVIGLVILCSFILADSPSFDYDCCEGADCVDCFCVQCLALFNNIIEPSAITFDAPEKICQSTFAYQASLDLLEPTFEIDQPPKTLI
jgi:hypothetical protein